MPHRSLTRRSAIAGTAALGSAGMLPPSEAATTPPTLRLEDPRERARILAKTGLDLNAANKHLVVQENAGTSATRSATPVPVPGAELPKS